MIMIKQTILKFDCVEQERMEGKDMWASLLTLHCIKTRSRGPTEMAQLLRAVALFPAPTWQFETVFTQFQWIRCPLLVSTGIALLWCTDMQAGKTSIHVK